MRKGKEMKVKELQQKLSEMNPDAEVMCITADGDYQKIYNCEEEYTNLVTIGLELDLKNDAYKLMEVKQ